MKLVRPQLGAGAFEDQLLGGIVRESAARSVGSSIAREITRGVLGSLLGGRKR